MLRAERSGLNLVGRINTSPKYVTEITGTDPLILVELGGGWLIRTTLEKNEVIVAYEWVIRS